VSESVVVAFRMPPPGLSSGPDGYLFRARALCLKGEELEGRLVAWSAELLAMGWDVDRIEQAVAFAVSIREASPSAEQGWAGGMAEGELESLSPDGQGILAWGSALLSAVSLAQLASAGEVLVDDDVRALPTGQLSLLPAETWSDGGLRATSWRLDMERPWKRPPGAGDRQESALVARVRKYAQGVDGVATADAIAELRRARARIEGGPASARCQASIALAMMLSLGGRSEEALLEALDALARGREANDSKAVDACMALLAKLFASVGLTQAATALREAISEA
jgi:hypothetical protein